MAMTMHVDIVSAEGEIYSGLSEMLIATAEMGEVGVMPGHAQLLTRLMPGEIRLVKDSKEEHYYVSGGMLEVQPHTVTILADTIVRASDLDEAAALEAKQRAEELLSSKESDIDYAAAQAELAQAVAQIRALERIRKNRH